MAYRVKDWKRHFENHDSRKYKRLTWVSISNKHDGKTYRRLMRMDPRHYLAWVLILQVASKCPTRGTLEDEDGPLTAEDLSVKTDCPTIIFEKALPALVKVGWLEDLHREILPASPAMPGDSAPTLHNITEHNITNDSCTELPAADSEPEAKAIMVFPCNGTVREWPLMQEKLDEYRLSFPGVDVLAQCRHARQWAIDNPRRRKTAAGCAKFVSSWLSREQNRCVPPLFDKPDKPKWTKLPELIEPGTYLPEETGHGN